MRHVLLVDNYDSFTYNLYQAIAAFGGKVTVAFNDGITVEEAAEIHPTHLMISPGPGNPSDAGVSNDLIQYFHGKLPVLGVCLGHQCIAHVFGGRVGRAVHLMHGKTSAILHDGKGVLEGLSNPFEAARYHSLIVEEESLPSSIQISAHTAAGEIMGLRVKGTQTEGVQFHPESYMTKEGTRLIRNFLEMCK